MIECPSAAGDRYFAEMEHAAEMACEECAAEMGYTREQAKMCEDGELDCRNCPWGGKNPDA